VQSLRQILLRYADLHPLIVVVEDYHWLDASECRGAGRALRGI
jgi:predicted ATPase